jgi:hypothetical protein
VRVYDRNIYILITERVAYGAGIPRHLQGRCVPSRLSNRNICYPDLSAHGKCMTTRPPAVSFAR